MADVDEYDGLIRWERRLLSMAKFVFSGFTAIMTTYVVYLALEHGVTRQFLGGFMTAFMLVLIAQVVFSRRVMRWLTRPSRLSIRGRK